MKTITWSGGCGTRSTGRGSRWRDHNTGFTGHLWWVRVLERTARSAQDCCVRLERTSRCNRCTHHTLCVTTTTSFTTGSSYSQITHSTRSTCSAQSSSRSWCWLHLSFWWHHKTGANTRNGWRLGSTLFWRLWRWCRWRSTFIMIG